MECATRTVKFVCWFQSRDHCAAPRITLLSEHALANMGASSSISRIDMFAPRTLISSNSNMVRRASCMHAN
eukprot:7214675-Heterocapsa_arctica.AAC.1